jgi:hypothetical protein
MTMADTAAQVSRFVMECPFPTARTRYRRGPWIQKARSGWYTDGMSRAEKAATVSKVLGATIWVTLVACILTAVALGVTVYFERAGR